LSLATFEKAPTLRSRVFVAVAAGVLLISGAAYAAEKPAAREAKAKAAVAEAKKAAQQRAAIEKAIMEKARAGRAEIVARQAAAARAAAALRQAEAAKKAAEAKKAAAAKAAARAKAAAEAREKAAKAAAAKAAARAKAAEEARRRKEYEAAVAAEAREERTDIVAEQQAADRRAMEARRKAEAARKRQQELKRKQIAEAKRKAEAARKRQQELERKRIAEEKRKREEERKRLARLTREKAESAYERGMDLYDDGELESAAKELRSVLALGVVFGDKRDRKLADTLKAIDAKLAAEKDARASSVAYLISGEKSLREGDYESADAYLHGALDKIKYLSPENRKKLAGLLKELEAKRKAQVEALAELKRRKGATEADEVRGDQFLEEVVKKRKVLEASLKTRAAQELAWARNDFERERYESAMGHVKKALDLEPTNRDALDLRDQLQEILTGKPSPRVLGQELSQAIRARIDQARMDRDAAIQRGDLARKAGRYQEAIGQYEDALELMAYLRRWETDAALEQKVKAALEQVRAAKAEADAALERDKVRQANRAAEEEAIRRRQIGERQKIVLFKEANAEYARGKYASAIRLAQQVLELDPDNTAALDLRDEAREKIRRRTWAAVYEAQEKNWENHRLEMRDKLTWPAGHIEYPAKEVWQQIVGRGGVQLPSAKAVKTPKELALEAVLDTEIEGFQFDETPLREVISFFKNLLGNKVDFKIDRQLMDQDILITLSLHNVTLRRALRAMLWDQGLNFIVSSNGYIYISTIDGCRLAEAEPWNLSLRQYNIQDLFIDLSESGGGGNDGGNGGNDSGNYSYSYYASNNDNNDGGNGGNDGGGATVDPNTIISFIIYFTGGARNWDMVGSLSSTGGGNNDNQGGGGLLGGGLGGEGEEGGLGGGALAALGGAEGGAQGEGPGRIMIEWQGWLMVNHVDRMHKKIEAILAELRSQERMMISVESRLLTFTDNFYREFNIRYAEGDASGTSLSWVTNGSATRNTMDGNASPFHLNKAVQWQFSVLPNAHATVPGNLSSGIFNLTTTFLGSSQRKIVINAAKDSEFAKTVSAPHLLCMNTQERDVSFTSTGTYVSGYEEQGNFLVPIVDQYTPSDVSLTVTPVVSADQRYVLLSVDSTNTVSTLSPRTVTIVTGAAESATGTAHTVTISDVLETSQDMQATAKVPDRGTLVLGGLIDTSETSGEGTVPILGSIPILKRLFVNSAEGIARKHKIFLVTPTIIMWDEIEP